jgi:hypothetical protein
LEKRLILPVGDGVQRRVHLLVVVERLLQLIPLRAQLPSCTRTDERSAPSAGSMRARVFSAIGFEPSVGMRGAPGQLTSRAPSEMEVP